MAHQLKDLEDGITRKLQEEYGNQVLALGQVLVEKLAEVSVSVSVSVSVRVSVSVNVNVNVSVG